MIQENFRNYSVDASKIDKEARKLVGCIVMSTDVNYNRDFIFSKKNQEELVELGNRFSNIDKDKCYSYLGHSRGLLSDDRIALRIGHWENFRIDGTLVRADLNLDSVIDVDPVFQARFPGISMSEYIYKLAETKSNECGFSMVVYISGTETEPVISQLNSIDLVEDPALTLSMFSQNKEEKIMEEQKTQEEPVSKLSKALELLKALDDALINGNPSEELVNALIEEIKSATKPASETSKPTEEFSEIEVLKNELANLKTMIETFTSQFSKTEVKEEKKFSISVINPVSEDIPQELSKEEHRREYHRLRKENVSQAAKYFEKYLSK